MRRNVVEATCRPKKHASHEGRDSQCRAEQTTAAHETRLPTSPLPLRRRRVEKHSRRSSSSKLRHFRFVKLRRRETSPDASTRAAAEAALRKIERLRAAYTAYRAHFSGVDEVMLAHLDEAEKSALTGGCDAAPPTAVSPDSSGNGGSGAGDMPSPAAERARLEALRKDTMAWMAYKNTGTLPERVFSDGIDLAVQDLDGGKQEGTQAWLAYLAPEQREQVAVSMAGFREYNRLDLWKKAKRDAWLAGGETDTERRLRRPLFDLMRERNNAVIKLFRIGKRKKERAAAGAADRAMPSSAPPTPATAAPPPMKVPSSQTVPPQPGGDAATPGAPTSARRRQPRDWLQFLSPQDRKRADALHASYNGYQRLRRNPAQRNAWLAEDDEQGARRRLYERVYEAYKEHTRLYQLGSRRRKAAGRKKRRAGAPRAHEKKGREPVRGVEGRLVGGAVKVA